MSMSTSLRAPAAQLSRSHAGQAKRSKRKKELRRKRQVQQSSHGDPGVRKRP